MFALSFIIMQNYQMARFFVRHAVCNFDNNKTTLYQS